MAFNIGTLSCVVPNRGDASVYKLLTEYDPVAVFCIGDMPYVGGTIDAWGYSTTPVQHDTSLADYQEHYDQFANHPMMLQLTASNALVYKVFDDHEWGGNDWDHSIAKATAAPSIGATTQAQVNTHWKTGIDAHDYAVATYYDNPSNTDADAVVTDADRPENSLLETQNPVKENYPVRYWRQGFDINGNTNNASPHLEVFVVDCLSYMDDIEKIDNASKTRLGPTQLAWLKAHLLSSTATFKMLVTSKNTYGVQGGSNADDWDAYTTERDEILAYIATNSITGVFWVSGDQHINHIEVQDTVNHTYDHAMLCACPTGQVYSATTPTLDTQTIWWAKEQVFGLVSVYEDYVDLAICNSNTGSVAVRISVEAGSNAWTVRNIPVAI